MKADYIELDGGRRVRVLWNMNALGEFTELTGIEMSDLADGKAKVSELRTMAWCSAKEGEAAEGKDLGLTEVEFGRLMTMSSIVEFSAILASQSGQKKSPTEHLTFPRTFFRKA